ncbi:MAG: hypothetical protein CL811_06360 [Colwelliaceae bacterium]|jgi:hypothetical protein|nr:hypothetical protein [Colwelliaceae bacterium]|tara:strand:+ start:3543 stop:3977 length:435 start_codon:yes stop_codon:yes gene_type:complete
MDMGKRREKQLAKAKKEAVKVEEERFEFELADRRRTLDLLREIENQELGIKLQKKHISEMKIQLETGSIEELDNKGNPLKKHTLERRIEIFEDDLKKMKLTLMYLKEDLFFKVGDKAEQIKERLNEHYKIIREKVVDIRKTLEG